MLCCAVRFFTVRGDLREKGVRVRALSRKTKRAIVPYLLALPAAALILVFLYGVVNGVLQGFGIMPFLGRTEFTLEYYLEALTRSDLTSSILYSLYLAGVSSIIAVIGGVAIAAFMTRARTGRFLRLVNVQIPIMTMHSLVALAVMFLFTGSGLVPRVLAAFGLVSDPSSFTSVVGSVSGWGIILVYAWKEIPFIAFSTVTIMASISDSLGEAAAMLGASPLRAFFGVTLPLCKGAIAKAFMVVFAFAFGSYEVPFLLGPTLPQAMPVLAYVEFQDPDIVNRCYAMALNGIMTLLCSLIALAYFAVLNRERKGGAR